mmetsp:Transcript_15981/g.48028  ORF Transcript_15981/g.48028 Transcript_15981/m.48028 type:complete len:212 (+) Transcript_15981:189-824(+)
MERSTIGFNVLRNSLPRFRPKAKAVTLIRREDMMYNLILRQHRERKTTIASVAEPNEEGARFVLLHREIVFDVRGRAPSMKVGLLEKFDNLVQDATGCVRRNQWTEESDHVAKHPCLYDFTGLVALITGSGGLCVFGEQRSQSSEASQVVTGRGDVRGTCQKICALVQICRQIHVQPLVEARSKLGPGCGQRTAKVVLPKGERIRAADRLP